MAFEWWPRLTCFREGVVKVRACWGSNQKGTLAFQLTLRTEGIFRPKFNRERRRSVWLFSI